MRFTRIKLFISGAIIAMVPFLSHAADLDAEAFKAECTKSWMEGSDKATDKVAFKNFGEKYCGCMSEKPLTDKDSVKKFAPVCMSQVLLRDTMDTTESEKGLANATQEGVEASCNNEWVVVNSGLNGITKEAKSPYCTCAAPKLMELNKARDNYTDKEWYEKVDGIAKDCAAS